MLAKKPDGSFPAAVPANEAERVAELRSYRVLDTVAEQAYDDIVFLASYICQTPIALISLIDSERQWFKARVGLDVPETHRDFAFCAHAIHDQDALLEVQDAHADERFDTNPLVTDAPNIRFYAGVPLVSASGFALGTLCAIDREPRKLSDAQRRALHSLAREVVIHLELRHAIAALETSLVARSPTTNVEDRMRALLRRMQSFQRGPGSGSA